MEILRVNASSSSNFLLKRILSSEFYSNFDNSFSRNKHSNHEEENYTKNFYIYVRIHTFIQNHKV